MWSISGNIVTYIESKCDYLGKIYGGVGSCGTMRVHASPSLNKRGQSEAGEAGSGVTMRPGQVMLPSY